MSKRKSSYSELQDSDSDDSSSHGQHEKRNKSEQYEQDDGCLCFHTPTMKDQAQQNGLGSNADSAPTSSSIVVGIDANVPTYCYKPLDKNQIRILELLPGEFGTPLKAELHTCHLLEERAQTDASGAPNEVENDGYEALSYAWGSPVFDHAIEISGSALLGITRSLHDALQHLRYLEQSRRIWADAVCINQRDDNEKSRQVMRMVEIYRQAQNVVVWLGLSAPNDELAFSTIEAAQDICKESEWGHRVMNAAAGSLYRFTGEGATSLPEIFERIWKVRIDEGTPKFLLALRQLCLELKSELDRTGRIRMVSQSDDSYVQRIIDIGSQCQKEILDKYDERLADLSSGLFAASVLLTRPWWTRLWVVQEVASRDDLKQVTIVSGLYSTSLSKFESIMSLLRHIIDQGALKWPADNPCPLRQFTEQCEVLSDIFLWDSDGSLDSAFSKIVRLGSWKCSVPHDRIYAMYGLLKFNAYQMLSVDYSREVGELFQALAWTILTKDGAISGHESRSVTVEAETYRRHFQAYSLLAMVGTESQELALDGLPSWVPNFDRLSASSTMKFALHSASSTGTWNSVGLWDAESSFQSHPTFDHPLHNTMRLKGRVFASVQEVLHGSKWPKFDLGTSSPNSHALQILRWYIKCKTFVQRGQQSDTFDPTQILATRICLHSDDIEHFGRLYGLYMDVLSDEEIARGSNASQSSPLPSQSPLAFEDASSQSDADEKPQSTSISENDLFFMLVAHHATCELSMESNFNQYLDPNRHLCSLVTSNGDISFGWVPVTAVQGDELCVFRGCRYPFLIRPAESGRHRLVGDAWTLNTTLKEALGGLHDCSDPSECREPQDPKTSCNSWQSKDPEMVDLIANLGEIVLE